MEGKILSVDIGESSVSLALVTIDKTEQRLAAAVRMPFAGREARQAVAEARKVLAGRTDLSGAACIASLPDSYVTYRTVHLPFAERKKIDKVIPFELAPLLPYSVSEMMIDFCVAGEPASEKGQATVLAGAVPRSRLREYLADLTGLGLDPDIVVPRGFTVAAVMAKNNSSALVVSSDGDRIFLACIDNYRVQFVRNASLPRDSDRLPERLGAQLHHTMLACQEANGIDFSPRVVYLAGPAEISRQARDALEKQLGLPVRTIDMRHQWQELRSATLMGTLAGTTIDDQPSGQPGQVDDSALGLVLLRLTRSPELNFRKGEFSVSGKWRQYRDVLTKTGLLAFLVLALGLSGYFYDLYRLRQQITTLDSRVINVFKECCPDTTRIVDPLPQLRSELKQLKEKSGMPEEVARSVYTIDILNDISRLIPPGTDVVVTRLVAGPQEVMVTGHTDAFNAVDTIKNRLGESPRFVTVEISSASMNKKDGRVHFKLRVTLS
ncbi:MAG: type II secretion system protein GspL [Desulfosudaceae bacterium]